MVVVGGGLAGLSAAIEAHRNGATVHLLEKTNMYAPSPAPRMATRPTRRLVLTTRRHTLCRVVPPQAGGQLGQGYVGDERRPHRVPGARRHRRHPRRLPGRHHQVGLPPSPRRRPPTSARAHVRRRLGVLVPATHAARSSGSGLSDPALVATLTAESRDAVAWIASFGIDLSDVVQLGGHSVRLPSSGWAWRGTPAL